MNKQDEWTTIRIRKSYRQKLQDMGKLDSRSPANMLEVLIDIGLAAQAEELKAEQVTYSEGRQS